MQKKKNQESQRKGSQTDIRRFDNKGLSQRKTEKHSETLEERQEPTSQTDFHTHIHVRIWKMSLTWTFPKCLVEK